MTATPLEETTNRDLTRWTLYAAQAAVEILERAYLADLPPLSWRFTTLGLVGDVVPSYGVRDDRAEFHRWADHLDALVDGEVRTIDGARIARAHVEYRTKGRNRVPVTITARIERRPTEE